MSYSDVEIDLSDYQNADEIGRRETIQAGIYHCEIIEVTPGCRSEKTGSVYDSVTFSALNGTVALNQPVPVKITFWRDRDTGKVAAGFKKLVQCTGIVQLKQKAIIDPTIMVGRECICEFEKQAKSDFMQIVDRGCAINSIADPRFADIPRGKTTAQIQREAYDQQQAANAYPPPQGRPFPNGGF